MPFGEDLIEVRHGWNGFTSGKATSGHVTHSRQALISHCSPQAIRVRLVVAPQRGPGVILGEIVHPLQSREGISSHLLLECTAARPDSFDKIRWAVEGGATALRRR